VRADRYNLEINTREEREFLNDLLAASENIGLFWITLSADSGLAGKTLVEAKLREKTGASVVAISRADGVRSNPKPQTVLLEGDAVGMIGEDAQIEIARKILTGFEPGESEKPTMPASASGGTA